jgi:acyl-CoA thioester hydrolase
MKSYCRLFYRIPFSETDAMGIVHHSNHARYLERGRVEFLRVIGLNYTEIMKQGFHFPLTDMNISFKKPLQFDDVIVVETAISQLSKLRLNFSYKIFTGGDLGPSLLTEEPLSGSPAVLGETFHCSVNERGRPVPMSAGIQEALEKFGEQA